MSSNPPSPVERALAWSVHLYTALGAVFGLAALAATRENDVRSAFWWMSVTVFIDATDGTFARAARVKTVVPEFDGSKLDDIVDYLNYVVVPVFFALDRGMLPASGGLLLAALPLLASAYGFCQTAAKTSDFFFTGFPSYWNVVIFYLYAFGLSPLVNGVVVAGLSILVFVPIGYLYPSRQPFLRPLTVALGAAWGIAVIVSVLQLPRPSPLLVWSSLLYPAYYFGLSFYLHYTRR